MISENIRKYRLQRGLKQEEVASGLCSISQFSKIENGKAPIKPGLLKAIAARLGVSVQQLQSMDDRKEELREMLEMSRNSLMAHKIDLALEYARYVSTHSKEDGDWELYQMAIFLELQALTQVFRYTEVIELLERVVSEDRDAFSAINQVILDLELGRAHAMTGNRERSYRFFYSGEEHYHLLEDIDPNSTDVMHITYLLSRGCLYMRHNQMGVHYARESKRLALLHGIAIQVVNAEIVEGWLLCLLGANDKGKEMYIHALEEAQKLRVLFFVALCQNNLGDICLMNNDIGEAKSYFQRALKNIVLVENAWEVHSDALLKMVEIALLEKDDEAVLHYAERAKILLDAKRPHGYMYRAHRHVLLGRFHLAHGQMEQSIQDWEQALGIYHQHSAYLEAYEVAIEIANQLHACRDERAIAYYRQAIGYDRQAQAISMK